MLEMVPRAGIIPPSQFAQWVKIDDIMCLITSLKNFGVALSPLLDEDAKVD
jgi:hypothetical protein